MEPVPVAENRLFVMATLATGEGRMANICPLTRSACRLVRRAPRLPRPTVQRAELRDRRNRAGNDPALEGWLAAPDVGAILRYVALWLLISKQVGIYYSHNATEMPRDLAESEGVNPSV